MSPLAATVRHSRHQCCADATHANAKRIHRDAQRPRQFLAAPDVFPSRVAIVVDDERARFRLELLQTSIETLEARFGARDTILRQRSATTGPRADVQAQCVLFA